jgi:transposase
MVKQREYSHDERVAMQALHEEGVGVRRIAEKFKTTPGGVSKFLKKVKETNSIEYRVGRGRKRSTTPREDRALTRIVRTRQAETATEASVIAITDHGITVSSQTIRRRLRESSLVARVKKKKPLLSAKHMAARLAWAKEHQHWTEAEWDRVVWSDESKFKLYRSDGRQWQWVPKNMPAHKRPTQGTVKFGGGSVMVWGCFSTAGVGNLTTIEGTMDANYYIDILADNLRESIDDLHGQNRVVFQQDNDPKHNANITKAFLANENVEVMSWPAQSPDLNPIEHLWDELERRVHKNRHFRTAEELWGSIQAEWMEMPVEVTRKLVRSMPKRIQEVIDNKGGSTSY